MNFLSFVSTCVTSTYQSLPLRPYCEVTRGAMISEDCSVVISWHGDSIVLLSEGSRSTAWFRSWILLGFLAKTSWLRLLHLAPEEASSLLRNHAEPLRF